MAQPDVDALRELLTLDELTNRVGVSVRNVRFYTAKGLVPPPIRRGRSGYYSAVHVARLELVRELQGHGFTLAAIERYLDRLPDEATPEDVALHRTMLAPWHSETLEEMPHEELERRAARSLTDDDLDTLVALGIVSRTVEDDRLRVATSQLSVGLGLLELGFPRAAAERAADLYAAHGRALAQELTELFRTEVWPAYREAGVSAEGLRDIIERLKPLSIASLVSAYEAAMDEERRADLARRSRRGSRSG